MAWAEIGKNGQLLLGCERSQFHLAQQIPGCNHDSGTGIWHMPLSWASYVTLRHLWQGTDLMIGPDLTSWAWARYQEIETAYTLRSELDSGWDASLAAEIRQADEDSDTHHRLFPPQRGGVQWLLWQRRSILGDDQGNGKTPQVIRALQILKRRSQGILIDGLPALVIAPGAALLSWQREIETWAPELTTRVVSGSAAKRRTMLAEDPPDVTLISWDNARIHSRLASFPGQRFVRCTECGGDDPTLKPSRCEVHRKELNEISWQTIVADEAHRLASPKAKWTRAVWWLCQNAPNAWLVTGTITPDHIGMLWPLLRALDPASAPARGKFLDLFAIKELDFHRGSAVLGLRPDTAEAFHAIVQPFIRRIPREVALPWLPKRMPPVFRYPQMTPAQARLYKQITKEALAEFGDGQVMVPANSLVRFGRQCQLASAMVELHESEQAGPDGEAVQVARMVAPSSKVDDLVDFLADNSGPLVVAANSAQLITLAENRLLSLKIPAAKIAGGMSIEDQDQAAQWFQAGKVRVIFLTPAAGGEAITLTASNTVYWMQPTPSHRQREQVIHRVDRIGSQMHDSIREVIAIAPGTVDERLYKLSLDKAERAEQVRQDSHLLKWLIGGEDE